MRRRSFSIYPGRLATRRGGESLSGLAFRTPCYSSGEGEFHSRSGSKNAPEAYAGFLDRNNPVRLIINIDDCIGVDIFRLTDQFAQSEFTPVALAAVDLHDVPGRSGLDLADGIKNTASINRVRCADKHFSLSDTYSAIAA
ncbi:protein of unknown function [Methylocella tundrae]|uniref:Uncharacterized protein n=1 Tax=Methylocella tundrae TaxID=227605 RepID=A0A4U8Z563_METTU|nr:protein of unknown function [Methylocella tundrae]